MATSLASINIQVYFPNVMSAFNCSFSSGPYTHAKITRLALEQFTDETGLELNLHCAELLMQASISSDGKKHRFNETYHCDNNNIAGCSYRLDQLIGEARRVPYMNGMTYHELASKYAIKHTAKLLKQFSKNNFHFETCMRPAILPGCGEGFLRVIERNTK